jgi:hypothetical protein
MENILLKKNENEKLNVWKNNIKNLRIAINPFKWIFNNYDKIFIYIIDNYSILTTRKSHIFALVTIMKKIIESNKYSKNKKNTRFIYEKDEYSKLGTQINNEIIDKNNDNEMSEKRTINYVSYKKILKKRDEYEILFNKKKDDNDINIKYLILCLYTYHAPLRLNYLNCKLINKQSEKNEDDNYDSKIYYEKNKMIFEIIHDKVIKSHTNNIIKFNKKMQKIIEESIKHYQRRYLLCSPNNNNKPMNKLYFNKMLKDIFDKRVTVDIIRSSYVIYMFNKQISMNEKKKIAMKMRTSVEMLNENYFKITKNKDEDIMIDLEPENAPEITHENAPEITHETAPEITHETAPKIKKNIKKKIIIELEPECNEFKNIILKKDDEIKILKAELEKYEINFRVMEKYENKNKENVKENNKENVKENNKENVKEINKENVKTKNEINSEYYEKNKERIKEQIKTNYEKNREANLRRKILYNINNGIIKTIKQENINKYNFIFDETKNKWY